MATKPKQSRTRPTIYRPRTSEPRVRLVLLDVETQKSRTFTFKGTTLPDMVKEVESVFGAGEAAGGAM